MTGRGCSRSPFGSIWSHPSSPLSAPSRLSLLHRQSPHVYNNSLAGISLNRFQDRLLKSQFLHCASSGWRTDYLILRCELSRRRAFPRTANPINNGTPSHPAFFRICCHSTTVIDADHKSCLNTSYIIDKPSARSCSPTIKADLRPRR